MLFNSFSFLLFFPIVTLLYFVIPHRFRYIWLLVASYYFYMSWNPKYALLIAASTVITYLSGLLISRENKLIEICESKANTELNAKQKKYVKDCGSRRKLWVALSLISNLALLFFFKYFYFVLENVNMALESLGFQMIDAPFDIILPVGISFYTFQALSYTMDVYRGEIYTERNIFKYALFVSFFPQLVAGPIERSKNLLVQINEKHTFDFERMRKGLLLMLWGFFMKLVVADRLAILVNQVYNHYDWYFGPHLVIATLCFGLQIYCDFASYSVIAIGSAQVMGFRLMDNFRQPFFSRSIQELWQRWHISLSTWFRDYVYIPLGGSRKGTLRKYINVMIVFTLSGLWHGANWTYVIWGALHGAFQVIGEILRPLKEKITDILGINRKNFSYQLGQGLITYLLFHFALIFFRAEKFEDALEIIGRLGTDWEVLTFINGTMLQMGLNGKELTIMIISIVILVIADAMKSKGIAMRETLMNQGIILRWTVYLGLIFFIIIFGIYGPGYDENQFIYFQF